MRSHGAQGSILTLLVLLVGLAGPTRAVPPDDCPTFLPDFRCDRDPRYEGFVAPMSMPYLFEEPFINTGVQFVGIWHQFPRDSALRGGQAGVLALQARLAITDKLAFIAAQDGFVFLRPEVKQSDVSPLLSDDLLIPDQETWTDITLGFKYALIDMPEHDFILTPVMRYQIAVAENQILSGQGRGVFVPSLSAAWGIGNLHLVGDFGGFQPIDARKNSSGIFYNLHIDYRFDVDLGPLDAIVPFMSVNGTHWMGAGEGSHNFNTTLGGLTPIDQNTAQTALGIGPFEGADIGNFGPSSTPTDLVTLAWGLRLPFGRHWSTGVAYERAFSGAVNLFNQRVTVALGFDF